MKANTSVKSFDGISWLLHVTVYLAKEAQDLGIFHRGVLVELIPDSQLLFDAFSSVLQIIITMIGHSQFVVQISDFFANLRAYDLFLDRDSFHHELFSASILLLLAQLNSHTLHSSSLLFICLVGLATIKLATGALPSTIHDKTRAL